MSRSIVPDLKTKTVWFLTGSQGLYGEETLRQVATQSQAVATGLAESADIPVTVVWKPVLTDSDAIRRVDLGAVAREAASRLDETGRTDGVELRFAEAAVPRLRADEGKVRQIALNLLANAVEAAREEAAAAPRVEVSWLEQGRRVCLQIDDHGPGIPAEAMARVFDPFFTTRPSGHGLGLAIARTLARAHGGDIELGPRPGGPGTRATLTLPAEPPAPRERAAA
jgi:signal transduction histidine kinase